MKLLYINTKLNARYLSAQFIFFKYVIAYKKKEHKMENKKLRINRLLIVNKKNNVARTVKIKFVSDVLIDLLINKNHETIDLVDVMNLDVDFWYKVLSEVIRSGISRNYLKKKIKINGYHLFMYERNQLFQRNIEFLNCSLLSSKLKTIKPDYSLLKKRINNKKYNIETN